MASSTPDSSTSGQLSMQLPISNDGRTKIIIPPASMLQHMTSSHQGAGPPQLTPAQILNILAQEPQQNHLGIPNIATPLGIPRNPHGAPTISSSGNMSHGISPSGAIVTVPGSSSVSGPSHTAAAPTMFAPHLFKQELFTNQLDFNSAMQSLHQQGLATSVAPSDHHHVQQNTSMPSTHLIDSNPYAVLNSAAYHGTGHPGSHHSSHTHHHHIANSLSSSASTVPNGLPGGFTGFVSGAGGLVSGTGGYLCGSSDVVILPASSAGSASSSSNVGGSIMSAGVTSSPRGISSSSGITVTSGSTGGLTVTSASTIGSSISGGFLSASIRPKLEVLSRSSSGSGSVSECATSVAGSRPTVTGQLVLGNGVTLEPIVTPANEFKPWTCPSCKVGFSSALDLQQHLSTHTSESKLSTNENKLSSPVRPSSVASSAHSQAMSPISSSQNTAMRPPLIPASADGQLDSGNLAGNNINNQNQLVGNNNGGHHLGSPSVSGLTSGGSNGGPVSIHEDGNTLLPCHFCGKLFTNVGRLQTHIQRQHGEKSCECQVCGNGFPYRCKLEDHMRTHTDERPFMCNICGRGFRQRNHMTRHLMIHTGERPFPCEICGRSFYRKDKLGRHLRTHVAVHSSSGKVTIGNREITTFVCDICERPFMERAHLVRHRMIHTGETPFSCHICGKAFYRKDKLSRHIRTHTGEKPYVCNIAPEQCQKAFPRRDKLTHHMFVAHGAQIEQNMILPGSSSAANSAGGLNGSSNGSNGQNVGVFQQQNLGNGVSISVLNGNNANGLQQNGNGVMSRGNPNVTLESQSNPEQAELQYSCLKCNQAFAQIRLLEKHKCSFAMRLLQATQSSASATSSSSANNVNHTNNYDQKNISSVSSPQTPTRNPSGDGHLNSAASSPSPRSSLPSPYCQRQSTPSSSMAAPNVYLSGSHVSSAVSNSNIGTSLLSSVSYSNVLVSSASSSAPTTSVVPSNGLQNLYPSTVAATSSSTSSSHRNLVYGGTRNGEFISCTSLDSSTPVSGGNFGQNLPMTSTTGYQLPLFYQMFSPHQQQGGGTGGGVLLTPVSSVLQNGGVSVFDGDSKLNIPQQSPHSSLSYDSNNAPPNPSPSLDSTDPGGNGVLNESMQEASPAGSNL